MAEEKKDTILEEETPAEECSDKKECKKECKKDTEKLLNLNKTIGL